MRKFLGILLVLVWLIPKAAEAQQNLGSMSCVDVRTLMDNPSSTPQDLAPLFNYIHGRLLADDDTWVSEGHASIAEKWSEEGMRQMIATVTATCASDRTQDLADHTDQVFEGIAEINTSLGVSQ